MCKHPNIYIKGNEEEFGSTCPNCGEVVSFKDVINMLFDFMRETREKSLTDVERQQLQT